MTDESTPPNSGSNADDVPTKPLQQVPDEGEPGADQADAPTEPVAAESVTADSD